MFIKVLFITIYAEKRYSDVMLSDVMDTYVSHQTTLVA